MGKFKDFGVGLKKGVEDAVDMVGTALTGKTKKQRQQEEMEEFQKYKAGGEKPVMMSPQDEQYMNQQMKTKVKKK